MNYFTILLLLLFAALALVQTYRLRDAADSAKHYKRQANWHLDINKSWQAWEDKHMPLLQVLNEHPTLHAKKLRRILNAHYKRQSERSIMLKDRTLRTRSASLLQSCMEVMEGGFTSKLQADSGKHAVREALKQVRSYTKTGTIRTTPFNSYAP